MVYNWEWKDAFSWSQIKLNTLLFKGQHTQSLTSCTRISIRQSISTCVQAGEWLPCNCGGGAQRTLSILGVPFFPDQLNSFYIKRGKKIPHILRNNPAMYPSDKVTKNKIIIIIYWNIVLAYLRTVSDGSYFPRWREVGEEDYRVTAEQTWSSFNLSPTLYERLQSIAFQRWHGADLCYNWWSLNMKCHRAQPFLQHRSHTEPGWEACGQQSWDCSCWPIWPCLPTNWC